MKKSILIFSIFIFISSLSINLLNTNEAYATLEPHTNKQYSNIFSLYEYWESSGYPDYVGGVYSTDGSIDNLTVLLLNDNGIRETQIRTSLIDDSGVSFGIAKYSYNEIKLVHSEIDNYVLSRHKDVHSVGIGLMSVDGVLTSLGEEEKELRVFVEVNENVLAEYTDKFATLYGDIVIVEGRPSYILPILEKDASYSNLPLVLIVILLIIAGVSFLKYSSHFYENY